MVLEIIRRN